eukprot:TRINITY_DN49743_c0_g1_i1.p1 TRINITY_DN49743_c0_g1~~TRINITY_DN49743_c0_g1_i1.p1  ORF type:complete len:335 (-),score=43.65 TRINITY_DN49743_c0_g1_i1:72-965(-)
MSGFLVYAVFYFVAPILADGFAVQTSPQAPRFQQSEVPELNRTLMICNAYAYQTPLSVTCVRTRRSITGDDPIEYKSCGTFHVALQDGDRLDFEASELDVGSFFTSGLPERPTTLLLVPHRRDSTSMAVSFQSHAFSELAVAQVAVVDAYRGPQGERTVKITNTLQPNGRKDSTTPQVATARSDDLRYNSIAALNPGKYQISLFDQTGQATGAEDPLPMVVASGGKYVIMRVGVDDIKDLRVDHAHSSVPFIGQRENVYPQELVVFPRSSHASVQKHTGITDLIAFLARGAARLWGV